MSHQHQQAIASLVRALHLVGLDDVTATKDEHGEGVVVAVRRPSFGLCTVTITVSDYWMYEGVSSYFVNMSHPSGDFICNMGTPHLEEALINLGGVLHRVGEIVLREREEREGVSA